ncbi:MAG: signal recognition particle-docking protein FtsY [candidate division WOR-3 bacterium]|nr:signal recognition particle-docking protein FtsY [candidate division WOR-3 bacterium]
MSLTYLSRFLGKLSGIFSKEKKSDISTLEQTLLEADVGVKYTNFLLEKVNNNPENLNKEILKLVNIKMPDTNPAKPLIILVCGVNGSGKTTTVAKLAYMYQKKGSVLLVSADTYRDAASQQLDIWAQKAGVEIVRSQKGQDAGAVVYDGLNKAMTKKIDTVLIDTAGRLHTRSDLMEELKKIKRVVTKLKPSGPDLSLLTIDATLGQNSIQQAKIFAQELGINGLILTKFDGTAKGGAIIPICAELKIPVLYLGVGEKIEDLIEFKPEEFVAALFTD